uniref:CSON014761 protein n=1 Tax=Culicoides sonorensis TaxID=179676 RepID=A0A336MEC6_CULSO
MNKQINLFELLSCTLILTVIYLACCTAEESHLQKRQANQPVGLFPFPRVGRSDPDLEWDNSMMPANGIDDYDDSPRHEVKRQGLVPFPRVGRAGFKNQQSYWAKLYNQDTGKRAESGAMSGMWFGPRLGRVQKRAAGKETAEH